MFSPIFVMRILGLCRISDLFLYPVLIAGYPASSRKNKKLLNKLCELQIIFFFSFQNLFKMYTLDGVEFRCFSKIDM